jgi:hypothetical protein
MEKGGNLFDIIYASDFDALKRLSKTEILDDDDYFGQLACIKPVQAVCRYWKNNQTKLSAVKWLVEEMHADLSGSLECTLYDVKSDITAYLITAKADVNEEDIRGDVPLSRSLFNPDIVRLLLDAGANVHHKSLPLTQCIQLFENSLFRNEVIESASLLMQAGAKLQILPAITYFPEWAIRHEQDLNTKWRNCVCAARELYLVMCRYRIPRDIRLVVVRTYVKRTWACDEWLCDTYE